MSILNPKGHKCVLTGGFDLFAADWVVVGVGTIVTTTHIYDEMDESTMSLDRDLRVSVEK